MSTSVFVSIVVSIVALTHGLGLWPVTLAAISPPSGPEHLFAVTTESGTRRTITGDLVAYDLRVPLPAEGQPAPPFPAVVLAHGLARDRRFYSHNAEYMAERGIAVLTPDHSWLITDAPDFVRNIGNIQDHVRWLVRRASTPGDPLEGLLDPQRIGLAGHSAGGAIVFQAALGLQELGSPVAALCLLDVVPDDQTQARAGLLDPLPFASLRSEPSACNAYGLSRELLGGLRFPVEDVRIVGASHCDPENPTSSLCRWFCPGGGRSQQAIYQRLLYLFFQDSLGITSVEDPPTTYDAALADYAAAGLVDVLFIQPSPARFPGL